MFKKQVEEIVQNFLRRLCKCWIWLPRSNKCTAKLYRDRMNNKYQKDDLFVLPLFSVFLSSFLTFYLSFLLSFYLSFFLPPSLSLHTHTRLPSFSGSPKVAASEIRQEAKILSSQSPPVQVWMYYSLC